MLMQVSTRTNPKPFLSFLLTIHLWCFLVFLLYFCFWMEAFVDVVELRRSFCRYSNLDVDSGWSSFLLEERSCMKVGLFGDGGCISCSFHDPKGSSHQKYRSTSAGRPRLRWLTSLLSEAEEIRVIRGQTAQNRVGSRGRAAAERHEPWRPADAFLDSKSHSNLTQFSFSVKQSRSFRNVTSWSSSVKVPTI